MKRRRAALRSSSIGVVALFVLAQASGFAHQFVVKHTVCAEHGELVHVADMAHPGETAAAQSTARRPSLASSNAAETHGHDHCLALVPRREKAVLGAAQPTVANAGVGKPLRHDRPTEVRGTQVALYRLAPKNSPPA